MKKVLLTLMISLGIVMLSPLGFARSGFQDASAQANDPGIVSTRVVGEVTAIDTTTKQITIKTDAGSVVAVTTDGKTAFMRAEPGAKSLEGAPKIEFTEVGVGDRILAMGRVAADRKSVPATKVVQMTKTDIAKKQEHDRAEWRRRGITGTVQSINSEAKEITVNVRARDGLHPMIIGANATTVSYRRYAPDSIKFSDAKPGNFGEIKVGDQVRALGEKSEDGSRFAPEEIVSGSFRTLSGTVVSVDPATKEIKLKEADAKQPITVVVRADSLVKRFPAEFAARFANRGQGTGAPGAGAAGAGGGAPQGAAPGGERPRSGDGAGQGAPGAGNGARFGGAAGGPGAPGGAGAGIDFQEMLDRMPVVAVTDLKPGDMIIVSSTTGADPSRVTAIAIVSGIEPIVNAMMARQGAQGGRGAGAAAAAGGQGGFGAGLDFGIGLP